MSSFPPIAGYAFLSDCEVSTLVAPDGSVEWLCLPRPDSPSVFGALLDRSAGFFRFGPANADVPDQRRYVPGTNVLETTWHTPSGWMTVHDLLVMGTPRGDERHETWRRAPGDVIAQGTLLRIATCFSGTVEVQTNCLPQFDYGKTTGTWAYDDAGYDKVTVTCGDLALELASSLRLGTVGARAYGRTTLEQGESAWIALSWGGPVPQSEDDAFEQLRETEKFWRDWLSLATVADHPWRPYIERSALALKGLSYAPTGAVMAAATTSLPETPGGERNWDYRFTWIRDSAFMLRALHALGFDWEAFEYFAFILDAVAGAGPRRRVASADHVRHRRRDRPHRAHARPSLGLPELAARADRQRGLRPAATRRVGHAPRLGRHPLQTRGRGGTPGMGRPRWTRRPGDRARAGTRPGHLGDAGRTETLRRLEGHVLGRCGSRGPTGSRARR